MSIWSELPTQRTRELVADVATIVWVGVWIVFGVRLYSALVELSTVGGSITEAGNAVVDAGALISTTLSAIPLVGEGVADIVSGAFSAAGAPLVDAGATLESSVLVVASVLSLALVAVALIPWLDRYLPWRIGGWRRRTAGLAAIHRPEAAGEPAVSVADLERILAARAIHRLEFTDLLAYTPDPIGDYVTGRHDRLARAERASMGLRP